MTKSVVISVAGKVVAEGNVGGGSQLVFNVAVPAGQAVFDALLYDQADGMGKLLGRGTVTTQILEGQQNEVEIVLDGVVDAITLMLSESMPVAGAKSSSSVSVEARDASGRTIIGGYSPRISVSLEGDGAAAFSLLSTEIASSSEEVTITYNGSDSGAATIAASAGSVRSTAAVTPGAQVATFAASQDIGLAFWNMAVDRDGNLWGIRYKNLTKISRNGAVLGSFSVEESEGEIAIDYAGSVWTASEGFPSALVTKFASDGQEVGSYKIGTGWVADFEEPLGLAVDPAGNLWVSQYGMISRGNYSKTCDVWGQCTITGTPPLDSYQVEKFSPSGASVRAVDLGETRPYKVATDGAGNLWVLERGRVAKFSALGAALGRFSLPSEGVADDLAVDECGNIWVASWSGNAIWRLANDGSLAGTYSIRYPGKLAVNAASNVWVTGSRISKFRFDGSPIGQFPLAARLIALGADQIWTQTENNGKATLTRLQPAGPDPAAPGCTFDPPEPEVTRGSPTPTPRPTPGPTATPGVTPSPSPTPARTPSPSPTITPTPTPAPTSFYLESTLAGGGEGGFADGSSTQARFFYPDGLALDSDGYLYVADDLNGRIRRVAPTGVVSTVAGGGNKYQEDGPALELAGLSPVDLAFGPDGTLYFIDSYRIKRLTPGGQVETIAGATGSGTDDGQGAAARFYHPEGITVGPDGNLYVADTWNHRIRKVTPQGGVSTIGGGGPVNWDQGSFAEGVGTAARFNNPSDVAFGPDGALYVSDERNHRIRRINSEGLVSTVAGTGALGFTDGPALSAKVGFPHALAVAADGSLLVVTYQTVQRIRVGGQAETIGRLPSWGSGEGVAVDGDGNVYVTARYEHKVLKLAPR